MAGLGRTQGPGDRAAASHQQLALGLARHWLAGPHITEVDGKGKEEYENSPKQSGEEMSESLS